MSPLGMVASAPRLQPPPPPPADWLGAGIAGGGGLPAALKGEIAQIPLHAMLNGVAGTLAQGRPTPEGHRIEDVRQSELNVFFSQYEDSSVMTPELLDKYLTNPEMMRIQVDLIDALADRVRSGQPPLTPEQFYDLALAETGDPGTALIAAHNVTKAMARGRSPIPWEKVSEAPLVYALDGLQVTFDPADFHAEAELENTSGEPSVFYAMFDADALGRRDEGDWYHFYLQAASSYYGASGELTFDDVGGFNPLDYGRVVDRAIDGAMAQMDALDAEATASDAHAGWRYANVLSYLEGAVYGADHGGTQAETTRESNLHRGGALFGLEVAGVEPDPDWRWFVPEFGAAQGGILPDTGVDMSQDTHQILTPQGGLVETPGDGGGNPEDAGSR